MLRYKITAVILLLGFNLVYTQDDAQTLLPSDCGICYSQYRILGGNFAQLGEYPWLAVLQYQTPQGDLRLGCVGSLINNRYILTAANCVKKVGKFATWKLKSVRIGDFDISIERDCLPQKSDEPKVCLNRTIVDVEESVVHENYSADTIDQKYDIALLRLSENVTFSRYVKPVCLPNSLTLPFKGSYRSLSWRLRSNGSANGELSQFYENKLLKSQCPAEIGDGGEVDGLFIDQRCGNDKSEDYCRIDSGMPYMLREKIEGVKHEGKCTLAGVTSTSIKCEPSEPDPTIFTIIYATDFMPWILSKLRP